MFGNVTIIVCRNKLEDYKISSKPPALKKFRRTRKKCGSMLEYCPLELMAKCKCDRRWHAEIMNCAFNGKHDNYVFCRPRPYPKTDEEIKELAKKYFDKYEKLCAACQARANDNNASVR